MAISYVTAGGFAQTDDANPKTFTFTVPTGDNRLLLVAIMTENTGDNITGVTYGGDALTRISITTGAGNQFYLYYKIAPKTGSNNLVISFTGSTLTTSGNWAVYTGVKQVAYNAKAVNRVTSTSCTVTVTLTATAWLILIARVDWGASLSAGSGATQRYNNYFWFGDSNGTLESGDRTITVNASSSATIGGMAQGFEEATPTSTVKKYLGVTQATIKKASILAIASCKKIMGVSNA